MREKTLSYVRISKEVAYRIKQDYYTRILDYILRKTRFYMSTEIDVLMQSEAC